MPSRCPTSRYRTFIALSRKVSIVVNAIRARTASGNSASSGRLRPKPVTTITTSRTPIWSTKSTIATPIEDSGRISRGNAIFLTRFALSSTAREPVETDAENRFQANSPGAGSGVVRHLVAEDPHHEREHREVHERVQRRPHGPEDRGRVLHLQLLAREVREDLAVRGEDAEPLAHPKVRRLGGAQGGLEGVHPGSAGARPACGRV